MRTSSTATHGTTRALSAGFHTTPRPPLSLRAPPLPAPLPTDHFPVRTAPAVAPPSPVRPRPAAARVSRAISPLLAESQAMAPARRRQAAAAAAAAATGTQAACRLPLAAAAAGRPTATPGAALAAERRPPQDWNLARVAEARSLCCTRARSHAGRPAAAGAAGAVATPAPGHTPGASALALFPCPCMPDASGAAERRLH